MRRSVQAVATISAILLVSGCGGRAPQPAVVRAPSPAVVATPVMISAAAYVAAASSIDLFAMKSAELALQRARDPATRALAERVRNAHQGTSGQLSFAGRRLNLLPSASLGPEHQAMLDQLMSASDFDSTYRAQQRIIAEQGVRLHGGYARTGDSPTLRPVAANAENVMRANLQALRGSR